MQGPSPSKPRDQAPEITEANFTLKDLVRIAESCTSLDELTDRLKEVEPRE